MYRTLIGDFSTKEIEIVLNQNVTSHENVYFQFAYLGSIKSMTPK